MSSLLTNAPGWNIDVPAGTMLIRADVVMNQRPGAGGFAAIIEAKDLPETILIRGGTPDTTTDGMARVLIAKLAQEIRGNRAVVLTRNEPIGQILATAFKPFKMIRMLGNSPAAVADATRHAAVMAERVEGTRKDHFDRLLSARYEVSEHYSENQDIGTVHTALQNLLKALVGADLQKADVKRAAQKVLDASEHALKVKQREAIRSLTANDIPKATKES